MALLNSVAFIAGTTLPLIAPISLALPLLGAATAYTYYRESLTESKPALLKIAHVAMAFFSFTAGAISGNLVLNIFLIKNLFTTTVTAGQTLNLVSGMQKLAITVGFTCPLISLMARVWYNSITLLRTCTKEGAMAVMAYPKVRQFILTRDDTVEILLKVQSIAGDDFDPIEKANELMLAALEKSSDVEFAQFITKKVATGEISPELIKDNIRFKNYYETSIKSEAQEAIRFCDELEQKIDKVSNQDELEQVQKELTIHTQRALQYRKILTYYPVVDPDNQARLLEDLTNRYETFLTNTEQNTYRKKLRAKAASFEENEEENEDDEDVIFTLSDLFREADCQAYLKELKIADVEGKTCANIFHDELVLLGLDTKGGLKKAGYYPMPANFEAKKAKLLELVKREQGNHSLTHAVQSFTHGNAPINSVTDRRITTLAKRAFFQISMYGSAAVITWNNPITVAMAAATAINITPLLNTVQYYESMIPTDENFANCTTPNQLARQYAISLYTYSSPTLLGFKIGNLLKKYYTI